MSKEEEIKKSFNLLAKKLKNKSVILYGAGKNLEDINNIVDLKKLNIIGISDKKFNSSDIDTFLNFKTIKPNQIKDYKPDIILVTTKNYIDIIINIVNKYNSNKKTKVIPIMNKNKEELYSEMSYCNVLLFKLYQLTNSSFIVKFYSKLINQIEKQTILKFKKDKNKKNKVLIIEVNKAHGEVLPSVIKYFYDLGLKSDVLINKKLNELKPLNCINEIISNIYSLNIDKFKEIIESEQIKEYKYIFLNSNEIYQDKIRNFNEIYKVNNENILANVHRIDVFKNDECIPFVLTELENNINAKMLNPSYFKNTKLKNKNKITNFLVVGNVEKNRRNYDLLFEAIYKLKNSKKSFKLTLIGEIKENIIPKEIKKYINIKGKLTYNKMYKEIEKSDYILALLDKDNEMHQRYNQYGTSGTFQLVYGFKIPCIIQKYFSEKHFLNSNNSIIYEENEDFLKALKYAINLNDENYLKLKFNLEELKNMLYKKSINNLKNITNQIDT